MKIILKIYLALFSLQITVAQWIPSNGFGGGYSYDVEVIDTTVFLAGFGIYKRPINGGEWQQCLEMNGIDQLGFSSKCVLAKNSSFGQQLLKSENLGQSWEVIYEYSEEVNSFCAVDSVIFVGDLYSVYRSYDNGTTWTNITGELSGIGYLYVYSFGNVIFVDNLQSNHQLFRSFDLGETWLPFSAEGLESDFLISIYIKNDTLWAGTWDGIFYSIEGTPGWTEMNAGLPEHKYIYEIKEFDGDIICSVFTGVYKFSGNEWLPVNEGEEIYGVHGIAVCDTVLFCASGDGPYCKNVSSGWYDVFEGFNHIHVSWTSEDDSVVWACTENGLYKSDDFGMNFYRAPPDTLSNCFKLLITYNAYYLACSEGFFVTYNKGAIWLKRSDGLENHPVSDIAIFGPFSFAATSWGLYRATTGVFEWEKVPNSLGNSNIANVAIIDSTVLVSAESTALYRSVNLGDSFEIIDGFPLDLVTINNRFYTIYYDPRYSYDGLTWTTLYIDDDNYRGYCIDVQEDVIITGGSKVSIVTYDSFLSISLDEGVTWTDRKDNLPDNVLLIWQVNLAGTRTFVSPMYNGLYYRDDLLTGLGHPREMKKPGMRVYPNPFSEEIYVEMIDIQGEKISIEVFDLTGQSVMKRQNRETSPSITIDLKFLSPGIYLLKASSINSSFISKIIKR